MGQISKELIHAIEICRKCQTIHGHSKFPITSHGQLSGKYLLVSEAPGRESLFKNQYWTGVGGHILRSCTSAAGTTLEELFYLTDIVKCWPNENGNNRPPYDIELKNCSNFLEKEIYELKPSLVVSFGKPASTFLLSREVRLKSEHGSIYNYNDATKILVLLHPSGIDRHMNRDIYMQQLISLFKKLKSGKHNEISEIFNS